MLTFSRKEMKCAELYIAGKRVREIAAMVRIAIPTAEAYVEHVQKKLNCFSPEAMARVLRENSPPSHHGTH
jgi:DNA-binding CsgD family transcriptional regulator